MRAGILSITIIVVASAGCDPPKCVAGDTACLLEHLTVKANGKDLTLTPRTTQPWAQWAAADADDLFVATADGNLAEIVDLTTVPPFTSIAGAQFHGLWGSSRTDVWAAGSANNAAMVQRYDGSSFSEVTSTGADPAEAVWGAEGVVAIATSSASGGAVWTSAGGPFVEAGTVPDPVHGIWLASATDIWVAGGSTSGVVYRATDGATFTKVQSTTSPLRAIWGTSAVDVWAGGDDGEIWHFDGGKWTSTQLGSPIASISGTGACNVWAAGGTKTNRFDGVAWAPRDQGGFNALDAVWVGDLADAAFVGKGFEGTFSLEVWDGDGESRSALNVGEGSAIFGFAAASRNQGSRRDTCHNLTVTQSDGDNDLVFEGGSGFDRLVVPPTVDLTIRITDQNSCTPALCFSLCPKGKWCAAGAGARCSAPIADHKALGTLALEIDEQANDSGKGDDVDMHILPATTDDGRCGDPFAHPDRAAVGAPLVMPTQFSTLDLGGSEGEGEGEGQGACGDCASDADCAGVAQRHQVAGAACGPDHLCHACFENCAAGGTDCQCFTCAEGCGGAQCMGTLCAFPGDGAQTCQ